eukprot:2310421-Prymnesium_polylepis.1
MSVARAAARHSQTAGAAATLVSSRAARADHSVEPVLRDTPRRSRVMCRARPAPPGRSSPRQPAA